MSDKLVRQSILILNKSWQPINVKSPIEIFPMLVTDAAVALDICGLDDLRPTKWVDWITLPIREDDEFAMTVNGPIRIPTVVVLSNYAKMPNKRPKLCRRTIAERDGYKCQYTGRQLRPNEGTIDHILPRSKGGPTTWENCVLAAPEINSMKDNNLPHEVGLKLLKAPHAPKPIPAILTIKNSHRVRDWEIFFKDFRS